MGVSRLEPYSSPYTTFRAYDKRAGKLLYDQPSLQNGQQFHTLLFDAKAGTIDFVTYNRRVRFQPADDDKK